MVLFHGKPLSGPHGKVCRAHLVQVTSPLTFSLKRMGESSYFVFLFSFFTLSRVSPHILSYKTIQLRQTYDQLTLTQSNRAMGQKSKHMTWEQTHSLVPLPLPRGWVKGLTWVYQKGCWFFFFQIHINLIYINFFIK